MRKLMVLVSVVGFMLTAVIPLAMAACSTGDALAGQEGAEALALEAVLENTVTEVVNNICPVMGNEVSKDTPYRVEHEGKVIGFCCAACVDKFNEDPEGYVAKLDTEATEEEE